MELEIQSIDMKRNGIRERYRCEGRSIDTPVHQKPGNVKERDRHRARKHVEHADGLDDEVAE